MRISDWSSDVCSSDLRIGRSGQPTHRFIKHLFIISILTMLLVNGLSRTNSTPDNQGRWKLGRGNSRFAGALAAAASAAIMLSLVQVIGSASGRERVCRSL